MNEPCLDPPNDRSDEYISDCCDAPCVGILHFPSVRQRDDASEYGFDAPVSGRCSACRQKATFHKDE